ncbi:MAG: glycosyltransferase family 4 protein [Candidatus Omnitrophica bacterium]|nr:glycosyltransferase family 4 protein [Candidatus Omnitrophota bacterium]
MNSFIEMEGIVRIAVILESVFDVGGGFQQELSTACLLNKNQGQNRFVFYTTVRKNLDILHAHGIQAKYLDVRSIDNGPYSRLTKRQIAHKILWLAGLARNFFEKVLLGDGIDLVYFLTPSGLAASLTRVNYVMTLLDLCHRDHPEFPEVNFDHAFESREYLYDKIFNKAVAVLVDSELGKANVLRRYGCDDERVFVAKFLPSVNVTSFNSVDVRSKYGIKNKYLFYPAQFWAHKNHVYILDGIDVLRKKYGIKMDVVFSGSDRGNLAHVLRYAQKLEIKDQVHYLGFVPGEDIASLYKEAVALVMPTYFGPTNIPPLEAFFLGCPVCYSNLPGLKDQVGDAAFLMDLNDPESLAGHVKTILNSPEVVLEKVKRGKTRVASWTEDEYWNVLDMVFTKYARKMKTWHDME